MDPDGRLWVVEMRGFMPDFEGTGEDAPVGQVVVLEDTDDDGRADKRTVFLDGLVQPRTVKVLDHGVLVIAPPQLILARDTNGDLKADTREVLRTDVGVKGGNPEHSPNSLLWGARQLALHLGVHHRLPLDARAASRARRRCRAGSGASRWTTPGASIRNWNDDPLRVDYLPGRAPGAQPVGGAHARRLRAGDRRPRGLGGAADAGRQSRLPRRRAARRTARSPSSRRPARRPSIAAIACPPTSAAACSSPSRRATWCGATSIKEGADGRLTATNAHPQGRVPDLDRRALPSGEPAVGRRRHALRRRHVPRRDPARAVPVGIPEEPDPRPRPGRADRPRPHLSRRARDDAARARGRRSSAKTPAELVPVLAHPNGWWRDTAQRLLVERGDASVAPALRRAGRPARRDPRTRLHALWTLDGLGALDAATIAARAARHGARGARRRGPRRRAVAGQGRAIRVRGRGLALRRRSRAARPLAARAVAGGVAAGVARRARGAAARAARARSVRRRRRVSSLGRPRARGAGAAAGAARARPTTRSARSPARSRAAATPAAVADLWTRIADARRPVAERLALARGVELALGDRELRRAHARAASRWPRRRSRCSARAHEGGEIDARRRARPRRHGLAGQAAQGRRPSRR